MLKYSQEPVVIHLHEHIGRIVLSCVSVQKYKYNKIPSQKFDTDISLIVPRHIERLYKGYKVKHFNRYYQKHIYEIFFAFVKAQISVGIVDMQAIRNFYAFYEVNEDYWSLDSAARIWRREKKHTRFCPNVLFKKK